MTESCREHMSTWNECELQLNLLEHFFWNPSCTAGAVLEKPGTSTFVNHARFLFFVLSQPPIRE